MNAAELEASDYRVFYDSFKQADRAYQKRIGYTRYFINVYHYDWTKYNKQMPDSFECDLQFELKDDEHINIQFNCTDLTLDELESKVEWLFTTLNCVDYENGE